MPAVIQKDIIGLPADQFVNKPRALQQLLVSGYNSHWNRHNSYHEDIQKHITGLPAGHFENKQEALQKLSTHFSLQLISENIQKHVIGLSADQFVNKSTALQQLYHTMVVC